MRDKYFGRVIKIYNKNDFLNILKVKKLFRELWNELFGECEVWGSGIIYLREWWSFDFIMK